MNTHKHEWKLIDSFDSWQRKREPLPKGQWVSRRGLFGGMTYIPGFSHETIMERIVDEIREGGMPHITSETWVCPCGERKVNNRTQPSLYASLGLSQQDALSLKPVVVGKNAKGLQELERGK